MFSRFRCLLPLALSGAVLGCQTPALRGLPAVANLSLQRAPAGSTLSAATGGIALRIHWPRRDQTIPASANLLVVTLYDALGNVKNQTKISRPAGGDLISVVTLTTPAARHLTLWARAYRESTETDPSSQVPVAVGEVQDLAVYDNAVTTAALELTYIPIRWAAVTPISPTNGGVGTLVALAGVGFNGFVDPNNATPSFSVRFTHQTVLEGNIPNFPVDAAPFAGTDLWIPAPVATRSSDTQVTALVPAGAVTGPLDYQVDGVSALGALGAPPVFTVLSTLSVNPTANPALQLSTPPGTVSLLPGQVEPLTAQATDTLGSVFTNPTVTWTSDNPAVGVVSGGGAFTARVPGTAHVTATSGVLRAVLACVVVNEGAAANFTVPLAPYDGTASIGIDLPAFNAGTLNGTASP